MPVLHEKVNMWHFIVLFIMDFGRLYEMTVFLTEYTTETWRFFCWLLLYSVLMIGCYTTVLLPLHCHILSF